MTQSPLAVYLAFLRLGCTSFGGPVAHLGYFRAEFVERRGWLDDAAFGECVAVSQLLPGPASSQTGMLVGWLAAGPAGAVAAWLGFTAPSAIAMTLIAIALPHFAPGDRLHPLLLVAAGVVLSAVISLREALAPDIVRSSLAAAAFAIVLTIPGAWVAPCVIVAGALFGASFLAGRVPSVVPKLDLRVKPAAGIVAFGAFLLTIAGLYLAARATHAPLLVLADEFFRIGSLVFGGGHVVLPLMQSQLATAGIVSAHDVLTGYAAAQAMPGPLFTLASYAGAAAFGGTLGVPGAFVATVSIFAPSFFLLASIAPFYATLARDVRFVSALLGANASVVGLLAAALIVPIASTAIRSRADALVAAAAFAAIHFIRVPAWILVLLAAVAAGFR